MSKMIFLSSTVNSCRSGDGGATNLATNENHVRQVLSTNAGLRVVSERIIAQLFPFVEFLTCITYHSQWLNSAGTGRNGVPQPMSGVPLPETAVPPPKVVVPPPGDAVLYFLVS